MAETLSKIGFSALAGLLLVVILGVVATVLGGGLFLFLQYVLPPPLGIWAFVGGLAFVWGFISFWKFADEDDKPKRKRRRA